MFESTHASTGHCGGSGSISILITNGSIPFHQTNILTKVRIDRYLSTARGENLQLIGLVYIHLKYPGHVVLAIFN